jgi:transglutaminase-like putative cysteine protease
MRGSARRVMKRAVLLASAIVALGALIGIVMHLPQPEPPPHDAPIERILRYRFVVTNPSDRLIDSAWFWTYAPLEVPGTQRIAAIETSHPHRVHRDAIGNQQIHFVLTRLPPYQAKVVSVRVTLALAESASQPSTEPREQDLRPEPYIESDDPRIVALAKRLTGDEPAITARQIYDWIVNNVASTGYLGSSRGAAYALDQRRGDCTELTYLFTALSRASGLPTRALAGYVLDADGLLQPHRYHDWTQVYVDGRWRTVDPQGRTFMAPSTQYIAMQRLSVDPGGFPSTRRGFVQASENIRVRMDG